MPIPACKFRSFRGICFATLQCAVLASLALTAAVLAETPTTATAPAAKQYGQPITTEINAAQNVTYRSTDTDIRAILITPKVPANTATPSVIVVHDIFGMTPFIKEQAESLAKQGYSVLLPNLYSRLENSEQPFESNDAWTAYNKTPDQQIMRDLSASIEFLQAEGKPTAGQYMGVVGHDMGGIYAMLIAGTDLRVSAAVNYYGRIIYATTSTARPSSPVENLFNLRAPLLSFYGSIDPQVPETHIKALQSRLANNPNKVFHETVCYPNVGHGFLVPTRQGYNKEAATQAADKTRLFLARFLRAEPPKVEE